MMGMPFRSEKQRRYMFANEPEIAERWTKKYGSKPVGVKKAVVMRPSPGTSTFSSAVLPALRERRKKPYQHIMSPGRAGSQKIQERIQRRVSEPKIISESMEDPYQGSLELAEFLASQGLFDDMSVDDRLYLQSYLSRPGETYAAPRKDVAAAMPEWRRNQLFMRPRDLGVVFTVMNNPHVESGMGIKPITVTPVNPKKPLHPTYAYTGAPIGSSTIPSKVQAALMENYEDLIQPPSSIYDVRTGEPMDISFQLLKPMIVKSPRLRYMRELAEENLRNILANPESDPAEKFYYRYRKDDPRATLSARDKRKGVLLGASGRQYETPEHREAIEGGEVDEQGVFLRKPFGGFYTPPKPPVNPNVDEPYDEMYNEYYNVSTGEPMDIAFQLLKERKSPEAMRRKLEYDKQYEKTPERRKYQRELHAERRRRGIYGTGDHMDISHTQGGRLTLEPEHANRARHFKDRGTLRVV